MDIAKLISDFGFPIVAMVGLGYFVYYVWVTITKVINPTIKDMHITIIKLIDQIRMLDNDMIRLNTKIQMILQEQEQQLRAERQNRRKEGVLSKEL